MEAAPGHLEQQPTRRGAMRRSGPALLPEALGLQPGRGTDASIHFSKSNLTADRVPLQELVLIVRYALE